MLPKIKNPGFNILPYAGSLSAVAYGSVLYIMFIVFLHFTIKKNNKSVMHYIFLDLSN